MGANTLPFTSSTDVCNLAIQNCGVRRIITINDNSPQAEECLFCYDKLRLYELRRSTWRFATRRAMLRIYTSTMNRIIAPQWAVGTTYGAGALVQDAEGVYWISNFGSNTGNTPGTPVLGQLQWWSQYFGPVWADAWSSSATYWAGDIVYKTGTTGTIYLSTTNNNTDNDPASGSPWVAMGTGLTVQSPLLNQPWGPSISVQPSGNQLSITASSGFARNLFPLPNGFLRLLSPDPKGEGSVQQNTTGAMQFNDWSFEGGMLVSRATGPLLLRFVADISNVLEMDPMFCVGLAHAVEYNICERLTQSNIKKQAAGAAYMAFMSDARLVNSLEIGTTEPQEQAYKLTEGPQNVAETPQRGAAGEDSNGR
jgi:hypothetical protein